MSLVLFSIFFILVGLFVMWIAIFGNQKEVKEFGSGIPANFFDFFLMIIYKLFPPILRRIFLFLLGLGLVVGFIYLLFFYRF
ncbi:hypothetical protein HNQ85_002555 [Anoxybacillus calidus]|jgi:hypothetical protein|uniref:Uncharacterized protein n=1 Tax=[Anoxybacillus] calidus TaxID=575178 RepID=A0A7W0BXE5_9BACL|nr:hypothetical protein [Anoxybacillus calidus]MBA2872246.1 hypothetical protein [Anoxybacillus calidus]